MNFHMVRECGRLAELLHTDRALVRFFARVYLHVVGQCAQLAKQFVAFGAGERLRAVGNFHTRTFQRLL